MNEELQEFLKGIKHGMFASRPTAKEGFDYAYELIETLPKEHVITAFTALHVAINSISDEIKRHVS